MASSPLSLAAGRCVDVGGGYGGFCGLEGLEGSQRRMFPVVGGLIIILGVRLSGASQCSRLVNLV
ncbi:hypothetical protein QQ045_002146 [Rhodiola kirilowii]